MSHPSGISPNLTFNFSLVVIIDLLRHFIGPFITLLIINRGFWVAGMGTMVIYEIESVNHLFSKHLEFRKNMLRKYVQKNAILPQFILSSVRLNELIGGTLIIENIFMWSGIGVLLFYVLVAKNYPLIVINLILTFLIVIV